MFAGGLGDWLVVEAGLGWLDSILLSHFKVLAEVLVTAPPVEVDHAQSLVSPHLMEVGVANIVLNTVDWHSTVSVAHGVELVGLSDSVSPVLNHSLLSVLLSDVEEEGTQEVESNQEVENSESVLSVEWIDFPVKVTKWIFVETRDVLGSSPSLGIVSWLVHVLHEFGEVSVSLLGQGTKVTNKRVSCTLLPLTVQSCQHAR